MLSSLLKIQLPAQRLWHNGPHPPQAGSSEKEVIFLLADSLCAPLSDSSGLARGVDLAQDPLDKLDVWSLEDLDVLELYPRLLGVLLHSEGQW